MQDQYKLPTTPPSSVYVLEVERVLEIKRQGGDMLVTALV
jgi:hypothetical protein